MCKLLDINWAAVDGGHIHPFAGHPRKLLKLQFSIAKIGCRIHFLTFLDVCWAKLHFSTALALSVLRKISHAAAWSTLSCHKALGCTFNFSIFFVIMLHIRSIAFKSGEIWWSGHTISSVARLGTTGSQLRFEDKQYYSRRWNLALFVLQIVPQIFQELLLLTPESLLLALKPRREECGHHSR